MSAFDTTPFWPSRRLWLKFFIGLICVPLLFSLLIWVFITFSFSPMDMQGLYLALFFLLLIGGPVSVGLLLAPSWRGVGAGFLALISALLVWNWVGYLGLRNLPQNVGEAITYVILSASGVSVLELIVRDITRRNDFLGLGIGVVAGFLVSLLFVSIFSPYHPKIAISSAYSSMFGVVGWSAQFAINWISAFFFIDYFGRRVGLGGGIVWAALIGILFGISFVLMK